MEIWGEKGKYMKDFIFAFSRLYFSLGLKRQEIF